MTLIETPFYEDFPEQLVALIHVAIPSLDIAPAMTAAFAELGAVLAAQGVAPTGPWTAHHFYRPVTTFEFELCSPIAAPIEPSGRVTNGHLRATRVAHAIYRGPYQHLAAAWVEFIGWLEANGHSLDGDFLETYTVGPSRNPDPTTWQTDLICPIPS
jgi:effector-binding domain-containing protein